MSDWDFLHEMHDQGYSPEDIADAAGAGYAPWEAEYLSSEWIDAELADQARDCTTSFDPCEPSLIKKGAPRSLSEQAEVLRLLVSCAERHFQNTGRYLQIWGELGEIYAEIKFGLCRHETHHAGSDGTIGGKLVEVKTISPEKTNRQVLVKTQGEFQQLLIVRIDKNFQFTAKLLDREKLSSHGAKLLRTRMPL